MGPKRASILEYSKFYLPYFTSFSSCCHLAASSPMESLISLSSNVKRASIWDQFETNLCASWYLAKTS